MSRRDVNYIYLQQQRDYLELLENAKEMDALYKAGKMPKERMELAQRKAQEAKDYYMVLAYFMLQLDKPYKGKERKEWESKNKSLYDCLAGHGVSREALIDNSKDILADFKEFAEKERDNANGQEGN